MRDLLTAAALEIIELLFQESSLRFQVQQTHSEAKACLIWLHGLGADGSDMAGVAAQAPLCDLPLRHIFLDAPVRPVTINAGIEMPAWYDILGMKLTDREDKEGLESSRTALEKVIEDQVAQGFEHEQIILAGFSQGGALALYTALQQQNPLGGLISLSSYLPLMNEIQCRQPDSLPVFMAGGRFDPIVLPVWTLGTVQWLKAKGYQQLEWHEYDMEHSICMQEIMEISSWLKQQLEKGEK